MKFPTGRPRLRTYPQAHRVGGASHDDGDRGGGLLECAQCWPCGDDHVDLETDQLGGQAGEALGPAFATAGLCHEMLSIHVAELAQSAQERVDERGLGLGPDHFGGHGSRTQDPDPVDLARGLGAGGAGHGESPESEAADERAPVHHRIT